MTQDEIVKAVKSFVDKHGHFPFKRHWNSKFGLPARTTCWSKFGSIEALAKRVGCKPNPTGCPPGKHSPTWKGGKITTPQGYIRVWVERPTGYFRSINGKRNPGSYILEHRLIMQNHLGRELRREEIVHHKNGIKDDNRIENLEIVSLSTHRGKVCCPKCQYEFKVQ